jgi:hypothetical protein
LPEGPTGKLRRVGRELYRKAPDAAELAAHGLTLADYANEPVVTAWPDTLLSLRVFSAMGTQWRQGFSGETGLDYGVLPEVWRRLKVPPAERDQVFEDLQVLEAAALKEMHRSKK